MPLDPSRGRDLLRWILRPLPLLTILSLVLVLLVTLEVRRRQGHYWYDVSDDYRFDFSGEDVQRVPVQITSGGFSLPSWEQEWQTALLRLSVSSGPLARWSEPSLTVRIAEQEGCRQAFERGAQGVRFANLCLRSSDVAPGDSVRLSGVHLDLPDQRAELLLFPSPDLDQARVLVLSPHPDDAEIAAFGLYSGRPSWVVTVTTGSYGGDMYRHLVVDPLERETLQAQLRVWDSLVVPRWGGIPPDRTLNLGYSTLALESMYRSPDVPVPNPFDGSTDIARFRAWNSSPLLADRPAIPSWTNLVGDLLLLLDSIQPQIVVAPHPALDVSSDHAFTTVALLEALEQRESPALHLFLYTNHHPLGEYFPPGETGDAVTLPAWFDASTPFRSLYAHPLDEREQVAKLFALEAMHDLRPPPEPVVGDPLVRMARSVMISLSSGWRDAARELSYTRRAVRSNELFWTYRGSDRSALRELVK